MAAAPLCTIEDVNSMSFKDFQQVFGNVVENGSFCAGVVWSYRPFRNVKHLHDTFCGVLDRLSTAEKQTIIRGFPDLAVTDVKNLTPESLSEHRLAGLLDICEADHQKMRELNDQYWRTFEMPFVICARQNRKEAILEGLETSLMGHSCVEELERALGEVKKICSLRLLDLVVDTRKNCKDSSHL